METIANRTFGNCLLHAALWTGPLTAKFTLTVYVFEYLTYLTVPGNLMKFPDCKESHDSEQKQVFSHLVGLQIV